jgi:cellulose synthase/poly-beta-1,6-N-acetylglucosamine synthase-like glycosyltransferase
MTGLLLALAGLVLLVEMAIFVLLLRHRKAPLVELPGEWPMVSVLVPMRNEESTLHRCIGSLLAQTYPADKFEILVADDHSEDATPRMLATLAHSHPFQLRFFTSDMLDPHVPGKAGALELLARHARGEILLMTDADMALEPDWIKGMVATMRNTNAGILTGCTRVESGGFQQVDWLLAQGIMKVLSDRGLPLTSMGNNMAIQKEAYLATGGYGVIPFSITEDFALFKAVVKKGYTHFHLVRAGHTGTTLSVNGWRQLLHQRKRWMHGAMQTSWWGKGLLGLQAIWFPVIALLLVRSPEAGAILCGLKILLQSAIVYRMGTLAGAYMKWMALVFFEFYSFFLSLITLISYFAAPSTQWKGRNFPV